MFWRADGMALQLQAEYNYHFWIVDYIKKSHFHFLLLLIFLALVGPLHVS